MASSMCVLFPRMFQHFEIYIPVVNWLISPFCGDNFGSHARHFATSPELLV